MNRKFLLAPLIVASMASFTAQADSGVSRFSSSGARIASLISTDSLDANNRGLFSGLRSSSSSNSFSGLAGKAQSASSLASNRAGTFRPLLAGLARSNGNSDSQLGGRLPTITTSQDNGDGKISQTVNIAGPNGGTLDISSGIEHSGQSLQDLAQQAGSGSTRSLDSTLKLTSSVEATGSRSSGGDNNALGLGRERSSDTHLKQSSTTTIARTGSATAAEGGNPGSRDVKRTTTSANETNSSADRKVAALTDSGKARSTSSTRDTTYGFKSTSSNSREGLKVTDATSNYEPNFKTESDRSNGD